VDTEADRLAGTASVVFSHGAYNDLVGEFGRLVVHPDFRGRGIATELMRSRIEAVRRRIHVGIVENRASHDFSQRVSTRHGFVPVGFLPMKLLLDWRESVALYVRFFGDALDLRRNHPRVIPEASLLAGLALDHCGLPQDFIVDDTSAPYPYDDLFELDELKTEGYASLLRIERGRVRHRDVFGPIRLHYGLFQVQARHSHYLIARRQKQVIGGIGFMIDDVEKVVRIFELISRTDAPIRFLMESLLRKCQSELGADYIDVNVSAYSPRMQRTLLEFGFLPSAYVPANVFHEVERLDVIRMARLFVPLDLGTLKFCDAAKPIADVVVRSFEEGQVLPRLAALSKRSPLFCGLSEEQRRRLLQICEARRFAAGERIFRRGQRDDTVHLILRGGVELASAGKQIGCVLAGQCIGETSLIRTGKVAPRHSLDATAATTVETASFQRRDFNQLVRRRPDIGVMVYRNLAADVSRKLHGKFPDTP
jgi:CRP-like cAMP-binding protein/GNAT superfamily N-acetyltransferase